jgi:Flp pilus assembly protein TadB
MKRRLKMPDYLRNRGLSRLEVAISLFALAFVIVGGILVVTQVVGHWVLPVAGGIAAAVGLMRYRAETEQKKRNTADPDE